jgi:hypothetical protein
MQTAKMKERSNLIPHRDPKNRSKSSAPAACSRSRPTTHHGAAQDWVERARLKESGYSHSYEADVVKPLTCFFRFLHHFRWFCVWQMRARNERTAAKTQKTVTCQCAAKLGQQRNGIIGRGPRSGKETVYAGFDLDQASRSTMGGDPRVETA